MQGEQVATATEIPRRSISSDASPKFISKVGWLQKLGNRNKAYRRRFFRLTETAFTYYKDGTAASPRGAIQLAHIKELRRADTGLVRRSAFEIVTKAGNDLQQRVWLMVGHGEKDVNEWLQALRRHPLVSKNLKHSTVDGTSTAASRQDSSGDDSNDSDNSDNDADNLSEKSNRRKSTFSASLINGSNVFSGWLYKLGRFRKNMKRRHFILTNLELSYYQSDAWVLRPLGVIDLNAAIAIRVLKEFTFGFQIDTPKRQWTICAETLDDMQSWLAVIEEKTGLCLCRVCAPEPYHL